MSKKLTIEEMQKIAKERGGKCLSKTYFNSSTKLLWECAEGHQWKAKPQSLKNKGSWCSICAHKEQTNARKIGIEEMQRIATERGGKCLSENYVNNSIKLRWQCAEGHQWETTPKNILRGRWCPYCANRVQRTIGDMQRLAKKLGGNCLSDSYTDSQTKLLWECKKGHQWEATPAMIKSGTWCPYCAGTTRGTLEDLKQIAEEHGGKCLSEIYVNNRTKLVWECIEGHQWEATPKAIRRGQWCPYCAGRIKGTLAEMQKMAKSRGGKCLSDNYISANNPLLWECAEGHQWETRPADIKQGHWCPYCAGRAKGNLEEMQQIAEKRGGKCLSETYINNKTKLLWQCVEGHQWKATPNSIKRGRWCPECSSGLGERICRAFFEQLFGKKFPKSYPKWLVNQDGNRMELDGYCKSFKFAFEHHGEQHYSTKTHFITTEEALRERQAADKLKRTLCTQRGIVLIEVPEIPTRLSVEKVRAFIKKQCSRHGVPLSINFDTKEVNLKNAYATSASREMLKELQTIAEEHGGKCLSDMYVNKETKLLWECAEGHQWETIPNVINRGHWCPYCAGKAKETIQACAGKAKGTIQELQQLAKERGGKCLSNTYFNSKTKLLWECTEGHQWEATPNSIKRGTWCPNCIGQIKGTIEEMQGIAEERGGKCLSNTYINNRTKLLWECAKGHQWEAMPHGIKRGQWCPYCAGLATGTIEEMQKIASERGGKCLSTKYVNSKTKLLWECAEGHQWETAPCNIKVSGHWCPTCAKKRRSETLRLEIEEMQRIAKEQGGKCLSDTYVNNRTKLLWECAKGHQWETTPDIVKSGHWCPYCAGVVKLTIEDMRRIAREQGGKCLSDVYVNNRTKLLWECAEGHQWETTPDSIRSGCWCPTCAHKKQAETRKIGIEEMQRIASERGGKCLSENYINNKTKLLWECAEGHRWEATPQDVKNKGSWCPTCARLKKGKTHS